jgi:hypothetical protein
MAHIQRYYLVNGADPGAVHLGIEPHPSLLFCGGACLTENLMQQCARPAAHLAGRFFGKGNRHYLARLQPFALQSQVPFNQGARFDAVGPGRDDRVPGAL